MNKRIHSLDLLRFIAALSVVIPHLLILQLTRSSNMISQDTTILLEFFSSISVEVFFVLSGFVLSPFLIKIIDNSVVPIMLMRSNNDIVLAAIFRSYDSAREAEQTLILQMNANEINYNIKFRYLLSLPHTITKFNFMNRFDLLLSQFREGQ